MGRDRMRSSTTVISVRLLSAVDDRLERWCREYGYSKTKVVEIAVDMWLKARHREVVEADRVRCENLAFAESLPSRVVQEDVDGLAKAGQ